MVHRMHDSIMHSQCFIMRSCSPMCTTYPSPDKPQRSCNQRQQLSWLQHRCILTAPQHMSTQRARPGRPQASEDGGSSCEKPEPAVSAYLSDPESWSLMGRVVSSDRLVLGQGGRQRLVLLAAAKHAGVTPEVMTQRMQELLTLMPDLSSLLLVLNPTTLAALAADTAAVADKLVSAAVSPRLQCINRACERSCWSLTAVLYAVIVYCSSCLIVSSPSPGLNVTLTRKGDGLSQSCCCLLYCCSSCCSASHSPPSHCCWLLACCVDSAAVVVPNS